MMRTYILQAVTSVHVGEGAAVGAVDLPVEREAQTGWPCIGGASIKGALRQRCRFFGQDRDPLYLEAFGREPTGVPDPADPTPSVEAGELAFGGTVLLALPLRSLRGTFVLATCPLALLRLARVLAGSPPVPEVAPDQVVVAPGLSVALPTRGVGEGASGIAVLEEIAWVVREDAAVARWAETLAGLCGEEAPLGHLAIVYDDVFAHAVRFWTPVRTRAAIGDTGVVKDGMLFTTETLPPETLLWGQLSAQGRSLSDFAGVLPAKGETWWVGGQRTTGNGRVAWYWRDA